MPRVIVTTSALVIGLALASATDLAQNIQGPAAPNFGVNSNAQTGGMPNTGSNTVTPSPDHENGPTNHRDTSEPSTQPAVTDTRSRGFC
jgi:hypothetical protein